MVNMARKGSSVAGGSRRVRRLRVLRVAELEQARAITVQLGNRQRGRVECNQTALWYTAAQKQCDKAVERGLSSPWRLTSSLAAGQSRR
jgi:hypothetical protein